MRDVTSLIKDRSLRDVAWLLFGLSLIAFGLARSLTQGKNDGAMIDQFRWSRLQTRQIHDGESVRLAGYMLPLSDQRHRVTKFILVPYLPSCTWRPPPLPDQTVLVETSPTELSAEPVVVRGELSRLKVPESGAGFRLQARGLRPWSHGQFSQAYED